MSNVTVNEYGVEALPSPIDAVDDDESDGGRSKVAVAGAILSNIFLFFLIYGLSATVETKSLTRHFLHNKKAILTGMGVQFIIMPLSGYLAVLTAIPHGLTEAMGITLLVLTASPGGSYSNWWCSLFNADLALSVAVRTGVGGGRPQEML
jgi:predicted Na+-dependent transporter